MATVEEIRAERLRLHGIIQDRVARLEMFGPEDRFAIQLGALQKELLQLYEECSHENRSGSFCLDCGALLEGATQFEQLAHLRLRMSDWGAWLHNDELFNQAYPNS